MADIAAQGIPDFGTLLNSFPAGQANIQNTQAQAAESRARVPFLQAQTGLAQANTAKIGFEVQMIREAMDAARQSGNGGDTSKEDQSAIDPTETGIASFLNKKYFVDPAGDPALNQRAAAMAFINPAASTSLENLNKLQVSSRIAKAQMMANDTFQTATALAGTNLSSPLRSMLSTRPGSDLYNMGTAIASMPNKSPEEKDRMARVAIQSAAKYSHQYTGRDTEYAGDQVVDSKSKFPVFAPRKGLTPGEQVDVAKFESTPQNVVQGNRESTVYPTLGGPKPSSGEGAPTGAEASIDTPGFTQEQNAFVRDQPPAFPEVKGNAKLNSDDIKSRDIYRAQRAELAKSTNTEFARAQDTVTHIKQIRALLADPNLTLGPGSKPWADTETFFNQWAGTPVGQAGVYQVLSKVLNASEMNDLLTQFHSEGAQVRLGAYESRLIMEKLAANTNLTKEAINQMLQWQGSDADYTRTKTQVAGAVIQNNRSVENFEKNYGAAFPKQDIVDTTTTALHGGVLDTSKVKGKTYSLQEVKASAAKRGLPLPLFEDQLIKAGATIR